MADVNQYFQGVANVDSMGNRMVASAQQQISDTAPTAVDQKVINDSVMPSGGANKYKAPALMYPLDLFDPMRGDVNHVRFFINVQSDAKVEVDQFGLGGCSAIQPDRSTMNSIVGKPFSTGVYAGTKAIEGALAGAGLGGLGSGLTVGGAAKGAAIGGGLAGGAAIATTTVLEDYAGVKFGQPSKRLAGFIALYMPNQLSTRYSMQWQDEEMDLAAVVATNPEVAKSLEAAKESLSKGNVGDAAKAGGGMAAKIVGAELLKKSPSLSAASRSAANPRKEQVFKGVDYRRFQFEYQFAPRDSGEAQQILNIVNMFKYHMHPEFKDSSNFIYIYPSEFDIEYHFGEGQNSKLHKISSCVLTEMNVNYSPNGVFSTFPDGMPTQINVQLSFTELELLTKERIKAGL
jgi:hypothetical protein